MPDATQANGEKKTTISVDRFDRVTKVATILVNILGFGAVAYGLHLNAQQLEASQRTAQANLWHEVSTQWLELDKFFLQNPDARNYVYGGRDISQDAANYNTVMAQATYVLDFIDYTINSVGDDSSARLFVDLWKNYAKRVFTNSPAVCHELLENEENYVFTTRSLGKQYCRHP